MTDCPTGKVPYGSAWEAWRMIRLRTSARSRFTHKKRGVAGDAYQCPACGAWHVTRARRVVQPSVPALDFEEA